jgi:conjugative relaxase-like TrwC/TraI family protein
MLRITASTSAAGAIQYFKEGLSRGDYYSAGETTLGRWGGKATERLGLSGEVKQKDFAALIYNQKPDGSKLNPRHSTNRKTGYDFTFSVPKSVSTAYAVGGDERIRGAFEESVSETMRQIEWEMRTQKGQGKEKHYPITGNMVWAGFTHKTSRPVDGIPDPHLHRHVFVFNTTWNKEKGRFQAGEFGILKTKAPYFEAAFNSRLAMKLKNMGYGIEKKGYAFELKGIHSNTLKKFSRRTTQIEELAAKEGHLTAKQKDQLGAKSRARKKPNQSYAGLKEIWHSWLGSEELGRIRQADKAASLAHQKETITTYEVVSRAVDHLLERKSVVKEYQVKAEALKRAYGDLLPEQIDVAMQKPKFYREEQNYLTLLTTDKALQEENRMLAYLRQGKGSKRPLNPSYEPKADFLNIEQRKAIYHALSDTNSVTIVSGGAGVGKTTLVKEIRDGVKAGGVKFFGFAPSAAASRGVMQQEGFEKADTLARLFVDKELQAQTKDSVIWVDEAGLIGNRDMNQLFVIAEQQNARILLTGDVKQHGAVSAGDALRILEMQGGIKVARVDQIQRQRNNPRFKQVVALTAKGKIDTALHQLDRLGGVVEITDSTHREQALVQSYMLAVKSQKSTLIVSPTHQEGNQITQALREQLKKEGVIGKKERNYVKLTNVNWTEEDKAGSRHYYDGGSKLLLEFHQHARGGHKKGDRWQVELQEEAGRESVRARKSGSLQSEPLPLAHHERYTVFRQEELRLSKGDKIRITKGSKTREGTRINNGDVFTIKGFTRAGHIRLHTGKTLDKDFGHIAYGYVTTSHSSQGKTVDRVLIAQSTQSLPASGREQFYVSISRAREMAKIFTDDKQALEKAVLQSGQRMTAREVAQRQELRKRKTAMQQQTPYYSPSKRTPSHGTGLSL